jgi:hypothetical protein
MKASFSCCCFLVVKSANTDLPSIGFCIELLLGSKYDGMGCCRITRVRGLGYCAGFHLPAWFSGQSSLYESWRNLQIYQLIYQPFPKLLLGKDYPSTI